MRLPQSWIPWSNRISQLLRMARAEINLVRLPVETKPNALALAIAEFGPIQVVDELVNNPSRHLHTISTRRTNMSTPHPCDHPL